MQFWNELPLFVKFIALLKIFFSSDLKHTCEIFWHDEWKYVLCHNLCFFLNYFSARLYINKEKFSKIFPIIWKTISDGHNFRKWNVTCFYKLSWIFMTVHFPTKYLFLKNELKNKKNFEEMKRFGKVRNFTSKKFCKIYLKL